MNIGFIIAYVILFLLAAGSAVYIYSYWVYCKSLALKPAKHNIATLVLYAILFTFLFVLGILYVTLWRQNRFATWSEFKNWKAHAGLTFTLAVIYCIYFILNILIVNKNAKNKVDYKNYKVIDFKGMFEQTKLDMPDIEQTQAWVAKKFNGYYTEMLKDYEALLEKVKDSYIPAPTKLADVVLFDEKFTHKWSFKANQYHKYLVIQILALI